jgi:uncharacterized protein
LCLGSIPGAFAGVLLLRLIGHGVHLQAVLLVALGGILVLAALAMGVKSYLRLRGRERYRYGVAEGAPEQQLTSIAPRPLPTAVLGFFGGLVVGTTSVGAAR